MSDVKQSSSGVIVKHDTHRQSPMQAVHSAKGQHNSQSHYKTVPGSVQPSHLMYDYRMQATIPTPNPIYIQQQQYQQGTSNLKKVRIYFINKLTEFRNLEKY